MTAKIKYPAGCLLHPGERIIGKSFPEKNTCVMVKTPAENTIDAISLVVEK
jgi:hypothetical protein